MIPLFDKNRTKHIPIVTISIIIVCIVEFIYQMFYVKNPDIYIYRYSFIPSQLSHISQIYRFITHMFLHGSLWHLLGNMLFLWVFGDNVEDKLGHIGFIEFYMIAGIAAALLQAGVNFIMGGENIPMIGASGAISGIMAAYLYLFPKSPILTIIPFAIIFIPAWIYIIIWFTIQVISGFGNINGNTAHFAHIGGFIYGFIYIIIRRKRIK